MNMFLWATVLAAQSTPPTLPPIADESRCIVDRLTSAERAAIFETFVDQKRGVTRHLKTKLGEAVVACSVVSRWTDKNALSQMGFAVADIAIDTLSTKLRAVDIDPGQLTRWFEAQSDLFRSSYGSRDMTDERLDVETNRMLEELEKLGLPIAVVQKNGALVGHFLEAKVRSERLRLGLAP